MERWFYSWNGEKLGPVSLEALQKLVDEGALEPRDLVWAAGMSQWQSAREVKALKFPDEPPPLPESQAIHQALEGRWEEAYQQGLRWLWKHKPVFFLLGLGLCGLTTAVLAQMRVPNPYIVVSMISTILFSAGLIITGIIAVCRSVSKWQRHLWLHKKWVVTGGDGDEWIRFSEDGGFIRSDGLGAKYQFYPEQDRIELRPVDGSDPIELKVVLLSEKELALTWDGRTLHYQKPAWWKRLFT